ncbi:lipase [Nocardioides sp. Root1257]|uniref:lipase family alpha/beta hydrolase n=1 Tax=unclassified Nocardioides TaxID=2615069 RepID=UPI0006F2BFED|nr:MULTISPECIES: alpha/beta fold hydrolase [unclassified Nocardioides]KQW53352.1 lipase [Nocardioides sp. Root1257]KRC56038.1 lipase [Nocardioides sp. Root224]
MLGRLSPARRRFVLGTAALVVVAAAATVVAVVATRPERTEPVGQGSPGPVLLVPGYGGSTASLDVLADALRAAGRDATVVRLPGDGTGDLRDQAQVLDDAARTALARTGGDSVDVIGYSAGGVVARLWVADLGGASHARRVVTLASPNHGTELASLASGLGDTACPAACRQLATDSDLLTALNAGDETPAGPLWVALWTEDDKTVVPPESGSLDGATAFAVQSVCPDLVVGHADVPRTAAVIAIVEAELGTGRPTVPDASVC